MSAALVPGTTVRRARPLPSRPSKPGTMGRARR